MHGSNVQLGSLRCPFWIRRPAKSRDSKPCKPFAGRQASAVPPPFETKQSIATSRNYAIVNVHRRSVRVYPCQFARVAKGVDLRSTAGNCAWVRTPQLTGHVMHVIAVFFLADDGAKLLRSHARLCVSCVCKTLAWPSRLNHACCGDCTLHCVANVWAAVWLRCPRRWPPYRSPVFICNG